MTRDLGDIVPLGITVRDVNGALVDAQSITLTITLPDGSTTSPAPAHPSLGTYTYDYVATQVGRHAVRWVTATPNTTYSDAFDVQPADMGGLISLSEAKEALNIPAGVTTDDEEIRRVLATASEMVESVTGPMLRRTYVELVEGGGPSLILRHPPVLAVTSITGPFIASPGYQAADLVLYPDSGLVRRAPMGYQVCFPAGQLTVTYSAGRAVIPASVQQATGIILDHLWQQQRGWSSRPTVRGESGVVGSDTGAPMGFALPSRAVQLLEPYRQVVVA